ncbi:hypothetical protein NE237_016689 [Protea cynaroides]|uniref:V-type proton ATPase proteolipid subunit n=1 Tax=Protea cynaroides TaxID=273540 RepID=A0A9Q0HHN2_9MAGN|nr:hypothetical protein NE237_016689 [Protea cynaroides]
MSSSFSGDETAPFFGFLGAAAALVFSCMGAAYGTAKSGVGVASMGVMRPELVMKSIVPVVMAGVLGIYGLIIAVIISTGINPKAKSYYLFDGYAHLSSGLACGLAGLSAGMAIGIVGDAGVRANAQQPKLFVGMILILIFAEALALYGLISKFKFDHLENGCCTAFLWWLLCTDCRIRKGFLADNKGCDAFHLSTAVLCRYNSLELLYLFHLFAVGLCVLIPPISSFYATILRYIF